MSECVYVCVCVCGVSVCVCESVCEWCERVSVRESESMCVREGEKQQLQLTDAVSDCRDVKSVIGQRVDRPHL